MCTTHFRGVSKIPINIFVDHPGLAHVEEDLEGEDGGTLVVKSDAAGLARSAGRSSGQHRRRVGCCDGRDAAVRAKLAIAVVPSCLKTSAANAHDRVLFRNGRAEMRNAASRLVSAQRRREERAQRVSSLLSPGPRSAPLRSRQLKYAPARVPYRLLLMRRR